MSKAEYADSRGWSRPYVSKLAKQGRLVLSEDGKRVFAEESDALIARTRDPSKDAVAERHQRDRVATHVDRFVQPTEGDTPDSAAPGAPKADADAGVPKSTEHNYQNARARREHYLARLAEMEALREEGSLAAVEDIRNAAFATARMLRDLLLGLPKQIGPELAAISDPWEVERKLTEELRRVLLDAERVSSRDLDDAINLKN